MNSSAIGGGIDAFVAVEFDVAQHARFGMNAVGHAAAAVRGVEQAFGSLLAEKIAHQQQMGVEGPVEFLQPLDGDIGQKRLVRGVYVAGEHEILPDHQAHLIA